MFLRGDYWHYDFIVGGVRYRGSTGFRKGEKKKAEDAVLQLKAQARGGHSIEMVWEQTKRRMIAGREIPLTVSTVWEAYEKKTESTAGRARQQAYLRHLRHFVQWMGEHYPDVQKLSGVLPVHAQEFITEIRNAPGANATKNDVIAALKLICRTLGRDYGLVESPFAEIKRLPQKQVPREIFTPEEIELIRQNFTGWIKSLCMMADATGLREGDICTLKKSSVDFETNFITVEETRKTGAKVECFMSPSLREHLLEQFEAFPDSEYVFPELFERYSRRSDIGGDVKEFFEKIGIVGTTKKIEGYKKAVSVKDIHSFRHTYLYRAITNGVPLPIVQKMGGHASSEMTQRYIDHAGRAEKAAYLSRLPDSFAPGGVKKSARELTPDRIARLIERATPENLPRLKARILALLRPTAAE